VVIAELKKTLEYSVGLLALLILSKNHFLSDVVEYFEDKK
jgi:hypothetical protein